MAKKQDKVENLTEQYKYKGDGELISDKPSKPLKQVKKSTKPKIENIENTENIEKEVKSEQPTRKNIYIDMLKENRSFILKMNGTIIFDSDANDIMKLCFEENYFVIGHEKHSYAGLNFKFKK